VYIWCTRTLKWYYPYGHCKFTSFFQILPSIWTYQDYRFMCAWDTILDFIPNWIPVCWNFSQPRDNILIFLWTVVPILEYHFTSLETLMSNVLFERLRNRQNSYSWSTNHLDVWSRRAYNIENWKFELREERSYDNEKYVYVPCKERLIILKSSSSSWWCESICWTWCHNFQFHL